MRAVLAESPGKPSRVVEVEQPGAADGEVLVRIEASGLNPLDNKIRASAAPHARQPLPAILGLDLAGTVAAVGPEVTRFHPGDRVYGMTGGVGGRQGSLAEFAAVDARTLAVMPKSFSMRQAAALPLAFVTAWQGLVERVDVKQGDRVLVQGGAGGVGHIAVQIARKLGATVYATASARKRDRVESLGAVFIDYAGSTVDQYVAEHTAGRGFDVVFDCVGGAVLDASFHAVSRYGHVVSALGWGTHSLAPLSFKEASYSGIFTLQPLLSGAGLERLGQIMGEATLLADAGLLTPWVDSRVFTFDTIEAAYEVMSRGDTSGKLVVDVYP
jgi:NADPH:quinone reductase-like Zn-dependent oxidoreductase